MSRPLAAALVSALVAASALPAIADTAPPLDRYTIDPARVSVSGISSGGYMAVQIHVAHSASVMGAGIVAGGPYGCAGDHYPVDLWKTINTCLAFPTDLVPFLGPPDDLRFLRETEAAARDGAIDPPDGLYGDRVWLFSGADDSLVPRPVMDALERYYAHYADPADITYVTDIAIGHAWSTDGYGNVCDSSEAPYVNDCGYDTAGALLQHIHGDLAPPTEPSEASLLAFDQSAFGDVRGLHARGYVYVPAACAAGETCGLHVAFHGCRQNAEMIGDAFYAHAGYNGWAEANGIVVLYPQTARVGTMWPNPRGCWDWWGFTGRDFRVKSGAQIRAVKAMIDRIKGQAGEN